MRPSLTLGIEEEYLIVDRESLDLVKSPDPAFWEACSVALGAQVTGEFLQCQVEVGTKPHTKVGEAVAELLNLRQGVAESAAQFGYAPIAASTHPFAKWRSQHHTRKERYDALSDNLGQVVRRMLICGMHIHVGIEDEDERIDLMGQVSYFLPHLLALSTSSPFWEGDDTGLNSYRLTVFDALPRTGLPDPVESFGEYQRLVGALVKSGCIEDATRIWWDIRPSDKFPTLEQRITDICGTVVETAGIAAAYQCLLLYFHRLKEKNQKWRKYPNTLTLENRWQAQRHGVNGKLLDLGRGEMVPFSDLTEELIALVREEAEELGCLAELESLREIVKNGSSADRQRVVYNAALNGGAEGTVAQRAVVEHLIDAFLEG